MKEKAKELVDKYRKLIDYMLINGNEADKQYLTKQSALICVDEIMQPKRYDNPPDYTTIYLNKQQTEYWLGVKQEIEKI